jgi:hypothetical protein
MSLQYHRYLAAGGVKWDRCDGQWTFRTGRSIKGSSEPIECSAKKRWVLRVMQMAETGKMKNKDKSRKWMWWFLGSIVALQAYFVRELLAAFVLFALGFAAIAMVIGSLYMLHKTWALAVERLANSQHPVMVAARHGMDTAEDMARRPFRRPGSAAAR